MGLGDISLYGRYQAVKETVSAPAIALRMAVKIPTGDESRVFGSGHTPISASASHSKTLASRFIVYGNINGVFPTGRIAGLPLQPVVSRELLWSSTSGQITSHSRLSSTITARPTMGPALRC